MTGLAEQPAVPRARSREPRAHARWAHAASIAVGEWYSDEWAHGRPTAFRPPGYPVLLGVAYAVTGVADEPMEDRVAVGRAVNVLVGMAVVALIGVLALQLWGRTTALV